MSENTTDIQSEFSKNISRIFRRGEISKLGVHKRNVRDFVRELEDKNNTSGLADELVSGDFFIDKKDAETANLLYRGLHEKFPEVKAVLLLGSNVHGGKEIRAAFDTPDKSDFDCGIVYALKEIHKSMDDLKRREINNEAELLLKKKGIKLCSVNNPLFKAISDLYSEASAELALSEFTTMDLRKKEKNLMYFLPSFPKDINVRNKSLLLESLGRISMKDHNLWEKITNEILFQWSLVHRILPKHVRYADPDKMKERDLYLSGEIAQLSRELMPESLKIELLKTDLTKLRS